MTQRPANEFIASFVGVETILTGRVIKRKEGTFVVSVGDREIEVVGRGEIWRNGRILYPAGKRDSIRLIASKETTSARNVFPGEIEKIVSLGFYQKIQLDCGFPLVAYITNHSLESLSLREGKEVVASFKATAIHVIRKREDREQGEKA